LHVVLAVPEEELGLKKVKEATEGKVWGHSKRGIALLEAWHRNNAKKAVRKKNSEVL